MQPEMTTYLHDHSIFHKAVAGLLIHATHAKHDKMTQISSRTSAKYLSLRHATHPCIPFFRAFRSSVYFF